MKKKNWSSLLLIYILSCCSVFTSCDYNKMKYENVSLNNQLDSCKKVIRGYETDPHTLLFKAKEAYANKNIKKLTEFYELLKQYHPSALEFKAVLALKTSIEKYERDSIEKEKDLRMSCIKALDKNYDDVDGITWYSNSKFYHYEKANSTSLCIGKKNENIWLILKMSYTGDDWIFFKNAYLSYDGITKEIYFDEYKDKNTENDTGVWEWITIGVDDSLLEYLNKFQNGKVLKMRLSGKYTFTKDLSKKEVEGIKQILLAYDILKKEVESESGISNIIVK